MSLEERAFSLSRRALVFRGHRFCLYNVLSLLDPHCWHNEESVQQSRGKKLVFWEENQKGDPREADSTQEIEEREFPVKCTCTEIPETSRPKNLQVN